MPRIDKHLCEAKLDFGIEAHISKLCCRLQRASCKRFCN